MQTARSESVRANLSETNLSFTREPLRTWAQAIVSIISSEVLFSKASTVPCWHIVAALLLFRKGSCDLGPTTIIDYYYSQSSRLGKSHGFQGSRDCAKAQVLLETAYKGNPSTLRNEITSAVSQSWNHSFLTSRSVIYRNQLKLIFTLYNVVVTVKTCANEGTG